MTGTLTALPEGKGKQHKRIRCDSLKENESVEMRQERERFVLETDAVVCIAMTEAGIMILIVMSLLGWGTCNSCDAIEPVAAWNCPISQGVRII